MQISVELVPRSVESLFKDIEEVNPYFSVTSLNIPHIVRCRMDSLSATEAVLAYSGNFPVIPHLRAREYLLDDIEPLAERISDLKIQRVLVVRGDQSEGFFRKTFNNQSSDIIVALKKALPRLGVFAAFDPYRDLDKELDRVKEKRDAGADGFFTQPFFSLDAIKAVAEVLRDDLVFWGVAPVMSEWSQRYWSGQGVVFPPGFQPTRQWNKDFAREVRRWAWCTPHGIYLMPIKVPVGQYLNDVLD